MKLPARIELRRFSNTNVRDDVIAELTIVDEVSQCRILRAHLSVKAFLDLLTDRSAECEIDFSDKAPIGQQHEHKTEYLQVDNPMHGSKEMTAALKAMRKLEVDGWRGNKSDLENHHRFSKKGVEVRFVRWVPRKAEAGK